MWDNLGKEFSLVRKTNRLYIAAEFNSTLAYMFKNALICHQACVCGKSKALKDPKIVPFKITNCVDFINWGPCERSDHWGSLVVYLPTSGATWLCRHKATTGYYWKGLSGSKAWQAGGPGPWPSQYPGRSGHPSTQQHQTESLQGHVFTFNPPQNQQTGLLYTEILENRDSYLSLLIVKKTQRAGTPDFNSFVCIYFSTQWGCECITITNTA